MTPPVFEAGVATTATSPSKAVGVLKEDRSRGRDSESNRDLRGDGVPHAFTAAEAGGVEPRRQDATRVPDGLGNHYRRSFQGRRAEESNPNARASFRVQAGGDPRSRRPPSVGAVGFEPTASWPQTRRASRLRYAPREFRPGERRRRVPTRGSVLPIGTEKSALTSPPEVPHASRASWPMPRGRWMRDRF